MKRFLALLLSFSMIFCLTACNINQNKDVTADKNSNETTGVLIEEYIADLENGARARQNIGKKTTVFGKILEIKSTHCVVELMKYKTFYLAYFPFKVYVYMDTDTLSGLDIDDYIAVTGKIFSVTSLTSSTDTYKIAATKVEDVAVMDKIFLGYIKDIEEGRKWPDHTDSEVCDRISDYLSFRRDVFCIKDDEQLKNYLVGKWEFYNHIYFMHYGSATYYVYDFEFKPDGTCFLGNTTYWSKEGNWSVSGGRLVSFLGLFNPREVYVLTDNVFFCDGTVIMRITEEG